MYAEGHTDNLMGQNLKRTLELSALEESIDIETNTVFDYSFKSSLKPLALVSTKSIIISPPRKPQRRHQNTTLKQEYSILKP